MTNHERAHAALRDVISGIGASKSDNGLASVIREHIDAAVAALTAERDAADFERDIARKARFAAESDRDAGRALLAEVARLRDEVAALKADMGGKRYVLKTTHEFTKAALGRTYAVLAAVCDSQFLSDDSPRVAHLAARAVLADPEGHAAAEYVTALEAEHKAYTIFRRETMAYYKREVRNGSVIRAEDVDAAHGVHEAAHAAVEALRTVKP